MPPRVCKDCGKEFYGNKYGILIVCMDCWEATPKNPYLMHPVSHSFRIPNFRTLLMWYGQESSNDHFGDHIK